MKQWRVVLVLLSIVILLGTILAVKIMSNTPEKEISELRQEYEQQKENKNDMGINTDSAIEFMRESSKDLLWMVIFTGIIILFYMIVGYKIYFKLGINPNFLKLYVALPILLFFSGVIMQNGIISLILAITIVGVNLILTVMYYKIIGLNPLFLLIGFIPYIGSIGIMILSIIATCKLADCFGKGTGFKLGLIFLPGVFLPILAFSAE